MRGTQIETVAVKGRFVANSMRFLHELAAAGLGIAVLDVAVAHPDVGAGRLVRVLPEWSPERVPVHALTPSKLLSSRTKIFLDCLRDHLRMDGQTTPVASSPRAAG